MKGKPVIYDNYDDAVKALHNNLAEVIDFRIKECLNFFGVKYEDHKQLKLSDFKSITKKLAKQGKKLICAIVTLPQVENVIPKKVLPTIVPKDYKMEDYVKLVTERYNIPLTATWETIDYSKMFK